MNKYHDLTGENSSQTLIKVDQNGNKIGTATREECHAGVGKTHLAFMAFIFDKNKEIILAQRASKKSLWGDFWDASVVSHVLQGETVVEAAQRRGKEEMGVDVKFTPKAAFYYFEKYSKGCENEYCHVLIGESEKEINYNPVEIKSIRKISLEQLKKEIKENPEIYTPWLKIAIEKFNIHE